MTSSNRTIAITTIQSQQKSWKKERALTQPEKHSWDSISMGMKKLCGSKRQNTITTHNPKRVDKGRQTQNNSDTFHRVQIHNCKNQTRIHMYSSRGRVALPMQLTISKVPKLRLPPQKQQHPHSTGRMPNTTARNNIKACKVSQTHLRLARLCRHCWRIQTWRWGSYIWGDIGVHTNSVLVGVARGHQKQHQNITEPKRKDIKIRPQNGRPAHAMARNRGCVQWPLQKTRDTIQQQLAKR